MVYVPFVPDKPVIADDGDVVINNTRENLMALRDAVVVGALVGWELLSTTGPAAEPTQIIYDKGTERLKLDITWGTSGGSDGNPLTIIPAYDGDAGASYDTMGTLTYTYDSSGNVTSVEWT